MIVCETERLLLRQWCDVDIAPFIDHPKTDVGSPLRRHVLYRARKN